jgi:hypothetical protein
MISGFQTVVGPTGGKKKEPSITLEFPEWRHARDPHGYFQ